MLCQTVVQDHEFLQWRLDVVEVDVGDEAIDAGVDGRRSVAMHISMVVFRAESAPLRKRHGDRRARRLDNS